MLNTGCPIFSGKLYIWGIPHSPQLAALGSPHVSFLDVLLGLVPFGPVRAVSLLWGDGSRG